MIIKFSNRVKKLWEIPQFEKDHGHLSWGGEFRLRADFDPNLDELEKAYAPFAGKPVDKNLPIVCRIKSGILKT